MVNDAFRRHKRFHLLEKGQLSEEKVQTCENHQIRRADFLEKKSMGFWRAPCAKTYAWGVHKGVSSPLAQSSKGHSPALIAALVWLMRGRGQHQFVSLGGIQRPRTAALQLCTLCEHAVLANLVNPIKLCGSARLRGRCPEWAWFRETKGSSPGGADHGLE